MKDASKTTESLLCMLAPAIYLVSQPTPFLQRVWLARLLTHRTKRLHKCSHHVANTTSMKSCHWKWVGRNDILHKVPFGGWGEREHLPPLLMLVHEFEVICLPGMLFSGINISMFCLIDLATAYVMKVLWDMMPIMRHQLNFVVWLLNSILLCNHTFWT